ncbi:hypothetical protein [Peribacillus frigoritolerans]|uniref:hypothetical protein n=1 Tax=Peribacillus castrilensis TaxID=2897690 RepID=UPI003DA38BDE
MKKKVIGTAVLSLAMLFSVGSSSSLAASEKLDEIVIKYEQITDLNELYTRALNGISDLSSQQDDIEKFDLSTKSVEIPELENQSYSTSQLLEVENVDGQFIETYATTTFHVAQDITDKIEQQKQDTKIQPSASKNDDKWDSTLGVKAYSTITWSNVYDKNQVKHFKLTKITGGWSYNGAGNYVLSNRSAIVGQVGPGSFGSTAGQSKQMATSSNTYSYSIPSSWKAVIASKYNTCGVSTKIKITRGSSSWNLPFNNHAS